MFASDPAMTFAPDGVLVDFVTGALADFDDAAKAGETGTTRIDAANATTVRGERLRWRGADTTCDATATYRDLPSMDGVVVARAWLGWRGADEVPALVSGGSCRDVCQTLVSRSRSVSSCLVIVGPTASGKSEFAARVVGELGSAEILCVDSMTVYCGMDIGTAKPTASDRSAVVHHGLDIVDPDVDYSVAEFQRYAERAVADAKQRDTDLVMVGGTGLYVDAIVNGFTMPAQYLDIRRSLQEELEAEGVAGLYARLVVLDPQAAARMEPNNDRRIVRALEVCVGSGRPFSSYGPGLQATRFDEGADPPVMVGIRWPREELRRRIESRFEKQIREGFVGEAASLRSMFGDRLSRTARQALGYRELWAHLDGMSTLDEAIDTAIVRTRQFAVRQERWFRRDPRIRWLTPGEAATISVGELIDRR